MIESPYKHWIRLMIYNGFSKKWFTTIFNRSEIICTVFSSISLVQMHYLQAYLEYDLRTIRVYITYTKTFWRAYIKTMAVWHRTGAGTHSSHSTLPVCPKQAI